MSEEYSGSYRYSRKMKGKDKSIHRRYRAEALNGEDTSPIAHQMEQYLEWRESCNFSEHTIKNIRTNLRIFLVWAHPRSITTSEEVTRLILESYQRHLFHYRKDDGNPLGISPQRARLNALRGFFSYLCKHDFIPANPAADLETPRAPKLLRHKALDEDQLKDLFNLPDVKDPLGLRDRTLLELFYATGIRRGELAKLQISDVDLNSNFLFVNQGKGGKDRYVPIGQRAIYWLRRYLDESRPILALSLRVTALFISSYGEAMSTGSLGNSVKKYLLKAGITQQGGCHLLRHSCATHMLEGGADIRFIQQMLGHASVETTAIYTQVSIEQLKAVHSQTHPSGEG